jgi:hypothetical protein
MTVTEPSTDFCVADPIDLLNACPAFRARNFPDAMATPRSKDVIAPAYLLAGAHRIDHPSPAAADQPTVDTPSGRLNKRRTDDDTACSGWPCCRCWCVRKQGNGGPGRGGFRVRRRPRCLVRQAPGLDRAADASVTPTSPVRRAVPWFSSAPTPRASPRHFPPLRRLSERRPVYRTLTSDVTSRLSGGRGRK